MILFLILVFIIAAILLFRAQSSRQHWEMLSATNPEAAEKFRARKVGNNRAAAIVLGSALLLFLLAVMAGMKPSPKQNSTQANPSASPSSTVIYREYPSHH